MSDEQLLLQMEEEQYVDDLGGGELVRIPPAVVAVLHDDWSRRWVQSSVPLLSGRQVAVACLFDVYHVCVCVQLGPHVYEASLSYRTFCDQRFPSGREVITHTARTAVVTNRWEKTHREQSVVRMFLGHSLPSTPPLPLTPSPTRPTRGSEERICDV